MLKMMNQPEILLVELIEVLCESLEIKSDEDLIGAEADIIKLNCGRHEKGHFLDFFDFQMIETAESMLRTSLKEVQNILILTRSKSSVSDILVAEEEFYNFQRLSPPQKQN